MDINHLLLFLVGFSCTVTLFNIVWRKRAPHLGWASLLLFVLAVTGITYWIQPRIAGFVGGGAWLILVVLPGIMAGVIMRWTFRQQYGRARALAYVMRWLHPMDGWQDLPHLLRAMHLGSHGHLEEASVILKRYNPVATSQGRMAAVHLFRLSSHWEECAAWFEETMPRNILARDPGMAVNYIRALGEVGRLRDMVQTYELYRTLIDEGGAANRNLCRLSVLAFCGRRREVATLLEGSLSELPPPVRQFWRLTAETASGNAPAAGSWEELIGAGQTLAIAAQRRIEHPPAEAAVILEAEDHLVLDGMAREMEQEQRYGGEARTAGFRPIACLILIGLNLAAFAVELLKEASTDSDGLVGLGALVPTLVMNGEGWRLLTSMFLHFGAPHILMNMLGLWALGPYIELSLGRIRFLFTYLATGIGAQLLIIALTYYGDRGEFVYIGASGCIMGIVGATAAVLLRGWRLEKSAVARRRFMFILFIIGAQTVFDLNTPQVSSTIHMAGAALGFVIAGRLKHRITRRITP